MGAAVAVGFGLGLVGQGVRILLGLYKTERVTADVVRWVITLLIGGVAGALAALVFPWGDQLEPGEIVAIIAAGYAGADFIEGIFKDKLPGTKSATDQASSPR